MLGGDKGIREERSDGIASQRAREGYEARDFIEKLLKVGASVSPQGFAPKARTLKAKCGIPKRIKKTAANCRGFLVEIRGFEPLTYTMRTYRSTN